MNNIIVRLTVLAITMLLLLTSCNSEPSLQQYFVDSQEKDGFGTMTFSKDILPVDVSNLSASSKEAYNSVEKVNVLYYRANEGNQAAYEKETAQVSHILKDERYKTLMTTKYNGNRLRVLYDGTQKSIDELIVYGASPEMGMGIARVLGDDMNVSSIMKMMEEMKGANIDNAAMEGILGDLGIDVDSKGEIDKDRLKKVMAAKGIDTTDVDF